MFSAKQCLLVCLLGLVALMQPSYAFAPVMSSSVRIQSGGRLFDTKDNDALNDGVVELAEDDGSASGASATQATATTRFISQGEIDPETLNPDMSDPKQARVIIYIIISLIPVLFLIPLMLGSRELIPLDALPPIEL